MTTTSPAPARLADADFCDPALFDDPWDVYRAVRDALPIHRDERNDLWVVGRHEDVFHMSRNPERYCNRFGVRPVCPSQRRFAPGPRRQ